MDFHCQVKHKWISNSIKSEIGSQKILTGIWTRLCGYFLSDREMISVWILVSLAATYHWPLHQLDNKDAFLNGILDGRFIWSNHQALLLRESDDLHVEEVTLRSETISKSLVWALCNSNSRVWTLSVRERSLCILVDIAWEENSASCTCR